MRRGCFGNWRAPRFGLEGIRFLSGLTLVRQPKCSPMAHDGRLRTTGLGTSIGSRPWSVEFGCNSECERLTTIVHANHEITLTERIRLDDAAPVQHRGGWPRWNNRTSRV